MNHTTNSPVEQRENILIGQVQGCQVTANYMDDGLLYSAVMIWQGARFETDGRDYINLLGGCGADCCGDIRIQDWRVIRDLVQCDVIEELTTLALAHQRIAPLPEPKLNPEPETKPEPAPAVPTAPAKTADYWIGYAMAAFSPKGIAPGVLDKIAKLPANEIAAFASELASLVEHLAALARDLEPVRA